MRGREPVMEHVLAASDRGEFDRPSASRQQVVFARRPFGMDVATHQMPRGLTVAEYLDLLPGVSPAYRDSIVVFADDEEIPGHLWPYARPKHLVTLAVTIRLNGDNFLKTFAQIALLAASVFVATIPGLQPLAIAGLQLAIGAAGLAVNLLFRPPAPAAAQAPDSTQAGQASLTANVLAKGRPMPRVIGARRIAPPFITRPLREIVGDDEYIEGVLALAGPHQWSSIRIGDTLATDAADAMADVRIETRDGRRGEAALSLVTRYGFEEEVNITLSQHLLADGESSTALANQNDPSACLPSWHRVTSRDTPDEIWLAQYWTEGLFDDDKPTQNQRQAVRYRFRPVGSPIWHNCPEVHFVDKRAQLVKKSVKFIWGSAPSPLPTPVESGGPVIAYRETPVADSVPGGLDPWIAHSHFASGAGLADVQNVALYADRIEFYLDDGTFPKGRYEIEIIAGYMVSDDDFNEADYELDSSDGGLHVYDFFGFAGIIFIGWGIGEFPRGKHWKINIQRIASVRNANPAPLGGDALLAFRGKNRSFGQITAEASGLVPTYNAVTGEWSGLAASVNPADHLRDALVGRLTAVPLPVGLCDDFRLLAFRDFCVAEGFEVHAVAEGMSLWDVVSLCAAAGNGEPRASDLWGVTWEYDRSAETPSQMYTPRNSRGATFTKAFEENRPDALIVTYADAAENYEDRQIVVYDDGVEADDPDLTFEEVRYDWIDSEAAAEARGLFDLRNRRLRDTVYSLEAAYDTRMVTRGDLVGVQSEVWDRDTGSGVVKEILISGGNVTALVLDARVPVVDNVLFNEVPNVRLVANVRLLGKTSGCRIRLDDGTILQKAIEGPTAETETIMFSTPFAVPTANFGDGLEDSLTVGCLVTVGVVDLEYRRQIVSGVQKKNESTATLMLLDEAPGIHA